jgi:hypothetical protein
MKRCPTCQFLYYDEQDRCDMDGTRLRFTTKLPMLPAEVEQKKSVTGALTVALLAAVILGIVLFIFYPPHWRRTSLPAAKVTPANAPDANTNSQLSPSEASPHKTSSPSPKSAAPSRDPFAPMETRSEKPESSLPATKPNVTVLAPANRSIAAKPTINQVATADQTSPISQKRTTPSSSIASPSVHPVAAASPTPKAVTQNSNKDSKLNSFMKKAGRILKKPF